jgi:hypothetical protein
MVAGALVLIVAGCAPARTTWQQEVVFELHRRCETVGAIHLEDVRPDGSYRVVGNPGSVALYQRCTADIAATPEWQQRVQEIKRAHDAPGGR